VPRVSAAPYVPGDDKQIVERLLYAAADAATRELRILRDQLQLQPDNLELAVRLARRYIEIGRSSADPRYAGYAQAALAPWWDMRAPPTEVLVLRATLRQHLHHFDAAVADLDAVLKAHPNAAQARLTKATVLQVQGFYDRAKAECLALRALAEELVWAACLANVGSVSGDLPASYHRLSSVLARHLEVDPDTRAWVLTMLAEMAARAGLVVEAEQRFRAAHALDGADSYLLGAYADFLLDAKRPAEVATLLKDKTRADGLLLRYALALKALNAEQLSEQIAQLRARFEASRLRGDRVHLREEARFTLQLLGDASTAFKLAEENWQVQKEPADARILAAAALAAGAEPALAQLRDWLAQTRLEDVQLSR
jgi:predicted Zn-dependent protease